MKFLYIKLRTGADGKTSILYADGTEVKLNVNTEIVIKPEYRSLLKVLLGEIWARIRPDTSYPDIESAFAIASVKGSELVYSIGTNEATLTVVIGEVLFYNDYGKVVVKDSEESTAIEGQPPTPPKLVDPKRRVEWSIDIAYLGGVIEYPIVTLDRKKLTQMCKEAVGLQLANAYFDSGKEKEAMNEYLKVLALEPENKQAHNEIARLYFSIGDTDTAYKHWNKAIRHWYDSAEYIC